MSKAVLVMDMPETCLDCTFCFELDEGINAVCSVISDDKDNSLCKEIICKDGYCNSKPDWCPLKKVPDEEYDNYKYDGYCDRYERGWNSFRRIILGENNNV